MAGISDKFLADFKEGCVNGAGFANSELEEVAAKQNYSGLIDYDVYVMSAKEKVFYVLLCGFGIVCNRLYFLPPYNRALILTPLALFISEEKNERHN